MPLSGRGDGASSSKYKEREWKRSYGVIACAECRRSVLRSLPSLIVTQLRCRLKLKCDKNIPCSSCTRRGCPSICPNGAYSLIILFPGSVLPSSAISTSSPHLLLYTLRVLMFNSLTRLYSLDVFRKPRDRTRYTVRPYSISSR
jgi:hypothetical protein